MFKKSLNILRKKSLNENAQSSCERNAIFDMILGNPSGEDSLDVEEQEPEEPAKQESLHDLAEDVTTPDDDNKDESDASSKFIFDMLGKDASEERKLLEKAPAMKPIHNLIEKPLPDVKEDQESDPAGQEHLEDENAEEETPKDDKKENQVSHPIFDEKLLEKTDDPNLFLEDFTENTSTRRDA